VFIRLFITVQTLIVALAVTTSADYISPELIRVSTPKPAAKSLLYNPGIYRYLVAWQGIPVAHSEIIIGDQPVLTSDSLQDNQRTIRADTRTTKAIDMLYKLRHTSESIFDVKTLTPVRFLFEQRENSRYKRFDVKFGETIESKFWNKPEMSEPKESLSFPATNFTLDPLFGALFARSVSVGIGEEQRFDIWNGKNRYLITFKVDGREKIRFGKNEVSALRVIPRVEKLTDSKREEKRLRACTIWISDDDRREILKIESKVLVGRVSATLESFTPLKHSPPPMLLEAKLPSGEARAQLKTDEE
jgi:hypothetical protein